uniref:Par-3 family cell polarity regulator beta b n=1 Tax=Sinocyclocheilus anshuiensis TaxID=1608454 RepID=A0A671K9X8_9TELE
KAAPIGIIVKLIHKVGNFIMLLTRTVEISGEQGPLGIHVVPYCSSLSGRALGLHIRGVEENSRSKREGIFQDDECIVKINDTELMDKSFSQAQEIFRQAMHSSIVRLEVVPVFNKERFEKSVIGHLFNSETPDESTRTKDPPPLNVKPTVMPVESSSGCQAEFQESNSSLEGHSLGSPLPLRLSPTPRSKSADSPLLKNSLGPLPLQNHNKKGGKRLRIDLKKGPEGLGFTVVTRDSSVHGPGPILVKNILPRGAAVKDGRLQSGDRILEVNGVDITGHSQEELVAMLRSTKQGDSACLVVARQEDMFLPRELKEVQACLLLSEEGKEQLMFEVPLNDSGSAGLGVSLKGNKSRETGEDLGIFIKSIIHGGAAFKDGRLRVNDQLIAVNGETLLGKSNHEAMETLRRSMSMEGNLREIIQLVVLRALAPPTQATVYSSYFLFACCIETDEGSDQSSGRDTPASGSSRQGAGDNEENKKVKKKKAKGKKKDKLKSKGKEKEKKKSEEVGDELDKKTKKKGFGLLRQDYCSLCLYLLSSIPLLFCLSFRCYRIEAKHQELRERQVREHFSPPHVEDDDLDPNYARINNFRERGSPSQPRYGNRSPSPQRPPPPVSHSREPSTEDPLDGLYAKVNKQRSLPPPAADSSMDRIQQLRREYLQARREGAAPAYEELEARQRGPEYDPHRMPVRNPDPRMTPRYEDVERQYASLPRAPVEPNEYPMQPWAGHRDPTPYPNPQSGYHPSYPPRDNYPRLVDPRQNDSGFHHPPPQQRGPLRQDVPPSPTIPLRGPRFDTMNRGNSPERYAYGEARHSDPRQKSPMTAAV